MMRVCVVGSGYVGLVTGVGLAELGHDVTCVDMDERKVRAINEGRSPIFEAGLEELLHRHIGVRFRATTDLADAVAASRVTFVCVGTPSRADGSIDTSFVEEAVAQVGASIGVAGRSHCVIVKSTVVPGTTDGVVTDVLARVSGRLAGVDFGVGANPEFLTEGQAVEDFLQPDRLVFGGDELAVAALCELYAGFVDVPVVATNARTAEMIKYASNAMLATAISFANEIANLGSAIGGIDAVDVMRGVHLSRYLTGRAAGSGTVRAGLAAFYEAGCGYGGSCLPKDMAALTARGREVGSPMRMLEAVAAVNTDQPARLVEALELELGELRGRRIAVLGLAFKPDTDDVRCSPAFPVLRLLLAAGADVVAHDPVVDADVLEDLPGAGVSHVGDLVAAVKGADALVIVTRWADYRAIPDIVAELDPQPVVIDGRRMLERTSVTRYTGIGR
jgi:UDPglucose 6-dehydrogenase/GDP-mannose 6-dehydrogenase